MSEKLLQTGDAVPSGFYVCMQCEGVNPETVFISEERPVLPECPHCGHSYWYRV